MIYNDVRIVKRSYKNNLVTFHTQVRTSREGALPETWVDYPKFPAVSRFETVELAKLAFDSLNGVLLVEEVVVYPEPVVEPPVEEEPPVTETPEEDEETPPEEEPSVEEPPVEEEEVTE